MSINEALVRHFNCHVVYILGSLHTEVNKVYYINIALVLSSEQFYVHYQTNRVSLRKILKKLLREYEAAVARAVTACEI